jgi:hypothetical protein
MMVKKPVILKPRSAKFLPGALFHANNVSVGMWFEGRATASLAVSPSPP